MVISLNDHQVRLLRLRVQRLIPSLAVQGLSVEQVLTVLRLAQVSGGRSIRPRRDPPVAAFRKKTAKID